MNERALAGGISRIFSHGRCAFIPYIMAGDPDTETTAQIIDALTRNGADAIELGVPYGDPLADGPTIAAAGVRALRNSVGIGDVLALVRQSRSREAAPIVLFTYFNPVYQYGVERFAHDAAQAGAAAVIVPDIALEEAGELREALCNYDLDMPLLVAPSTPPGRATSIALASTGFVYVVSRLGVTGAAAAPDFSPVRAQVQALRAATTKPLALGFGISTPEHVRAVSVLADGVIVGSALIDAYAGSRGEEAAKRAATLCAALSAARR